MMKSVRRAVDTKPFWEFRDAIARQSSTPVLNVLYNHTRGALSAQAGEALISLVYGYIEEHA